MMKLLWVTNGRIGVKPMNTSQRQQLWNILGFCRAVYALVLV